MMRTTRRRTLTALTTMPRTTGTTRGEGAGGQRSRAGAQLLGSVGGAGALWAVQGAAAWAQGAGRALLRHRGVHGAVHGALHQYGPCLPPPLLPHLLEAARRDGRAQNSILSPPITQGGFEEVAQAWWRPCAPQWAPPTTSVPAQLPPGSSVLQGSLAQQASQFQFATRASSMPHALHARPTPSTPQPSVPHARALAGTRPCTAMCTRTATPPHMTMTGTSTMVRALEAHARTRARARAAHAQRRVRCGRVCASACVRAHTQPASVP